MQFKYIATILIVLFVFETQILQGQSAGYVKPLEKSQKYNSFNLEINEKKAISAFFDYDIVEVFSPSEDIIGVISETNNRLLNVMAKGDKLAPTTLLVLDDAGNVYNFVLSYSPDPKFLVYRVKDLTIKAKSREVLLEAQVLSDRLNEEKRQKSASLYFKRLFLSKKRIKDISKRANSIIFTLRSIFYNETSYFFVVGVKNLSNIDYEVSEFRVFIRSFRGVIKRKLYENTMIKAEDTYPKTPKIVKGTQFFVVKVPKRSFSHDKYINIEVVDAVGDRNVSLNIGSKTVNKSKEIKYIDTNIQ